MIVTVAALHMPLSGAAAATSTVVAAGLSGLELAGTVGGIAAAIAAVIGLGLTVAAMNRTSRREFHNDLAAARAEGEKDERERLEPQLKQARDDATRRQNELEFWRQQAFLAHGGPVAGPETESSP